MMLILVYRLVIRFLRFSTLTDKAALRMLFINIGCQMKPDLLISLRDTAFQSFLERKGQDHPKLDRKTVIATDADTLRRIKKWSRDNNLDAEWCRDWALNTLSLWSIDKQALNRRQGYWPWRSPDPAQAAVESPTGLDVLVPAWDRSFYPSRRHYLDYLEEWANEVGVGKPAGLPYKERVHPSCASLPLATLFSIISLSNISPALLFGQVETADFFFGFLFPVIGWC
jgi:hypothetical protein